MAFHYVYLLESLKDRTRYYVGCMQCLRERLAKHNAGEVLHTSKFRPWEIRAAFAFRESSKAVEFERYLKSHSGRAFSKRHF